MTTTLFLKRRLHKKLFGIPSALFRGTEALFTRFGWPLAFALFCFFAYEQGLRKFHTDYQQLHDRLMDLSREKEKALAIQKDLLDQINSQSDQAWVELTLMKELGLVPEGYQKFFFMTPD